MRVGVIGRTGMLLRAADEVRARGHQIAFIATCKAEPFYDKDENDYEAYAAELNVPFFYTLDISSNITRIRSLHADVCISVNWLTILNNDILSAFPFGVLNAHAGDLPRYKGNACPNWAILNFENKVGLTIHKMVEELDSGPNLLKRHLDIDECTYITDIYAWLEVSVPQMFADAIDLLPTLRFLEPDENVRTLRAYPRKPEDSRINWADGRRFILANVRASSHPFGGAFCFLNDTRTKVSVYRASPYEVDFDFLAVPGQVCMSHEGDPVIAARDGLIIIEECSINGHSGEESKALITKSMRNRLV